MHNKIAHIKLYAIEPRRMTPGTKTCASKLLSWLSTKKKKKADSPTSIHGYKWLIIPCRSCNSSWKNFAICHVVSHRNCAAVKASLRTAMNDIGKSQCYQTSFYGKRRVLPNRLIQYAQRLITNEMRTPIPTSQAIIGFYDEMKQNSTLKQNW